MLYYREYRAWIIQVAVYLATGKQDKLAAIPHTELVDARKFLVEIGFEEVEISKSKSKAAG